MDGDSDACSHVSSEVGTEQTGEGKCSSPATLPTATQPSLDEVHSNRARTGNVGVYVPYIGVCA